jgi:hypothetical protein
MASHQSGTVFNDVQRGGSLLNRGALPDKMRSFSGQSGSSSRPVAGLRWSNGVSRVGDHCASSVDQCYARLTQGWHAGRSLLHPAADKASCRPLSVPRLLTEGSCAPFSLVPGTTCGSPAQGSPTGARSMGETAGRAARWPGQPYPAPGSEGLAGGGTRVTSEWARFMSEKSASWRADRIIPVGPFCFSLGAAPPEYRLSWNRVFKFRSRDQHARRDNLRK